MPSKYQITKAAAEVLKTEVFSNEPEYRRFLTTAARNYKYGFVDQLLIFWQKPDAYTTVNEHTKVYLQISSGPKETEPPETSPLPTDAPAVTEAPDATPEPVAPVNN